MKMMVSCYCIAAATSKVNDSKALNGFPCNGHNTNN